MPWSARFQSLALRLAVPLLACVLNASCKSLVDSLGRDDRPVPNEVNQVPVQRAAVVPALLAQIDTNGLFRYLPPNVTAGDMPYDTALAQAREFLLYAQTSLWRGTAENGRGAFIDMGKLGPCGYGQLVPSVYEPAPATFGRVTQIRMGDFWSIPFCGERKEPEAVVEIAARRNDTRYYNRERSGPPADEAQAFSVIGVPWQWRAQYMVTPEYAVNIIFESTGVRVARLADLHRAKYCGDLLDGRRIFGPGCSLWRVTLERGLRVFTRYSQRRLELSELYVGNNDCPGPRGSAVLLTAWPNQPQAQEFVDFVSDSAAPNGFRREVRIVRFLAPVEFETVIMEK